MDAGNDPQAHDGAPPRKFVRRHYLIDPATQLRFGLLLLGVLICAAAGIAGLWVLGSRLEGDQTAIGDPAASGRLVWWVDLAYFAFTAVAMLVLTIRSTHRFVGPGLVIERALSRMCEGDFSARLQLRRHDKLKNVAQAAEILARKLRTDKGWLDRFALDLDEAVKNGDLDLIREKSSLLMAQVDPKASVFDAFQLSTDAVEHPVEQVPAEG